MNHLSIRIAVGSTWLVAMGVLCACDGSSASDDTSGSPTPDGTTMSTTDPGAPTTPDDGQLGLALQRALSARLINPSEYFGMTQNGGLRFLTGQEMAISDSAPGATQRYASEGLLGVAAEHFASRRSIDALCTVMRYRQPAGALHNLRSATDVPAADKVRTFAVRGIPHAVGTEVYVDGKVLGRNVLFVDGPYEYIVGFQPDPTVPRTFSRRQLADAALQWFQRVTSR